MDQPLHVVFMISTCAVTRYESHRVTCAFLPLCFQVLICWPTLSGLSWGSLVAAFSWSKVAFCSQSLPYQLMNCTSPSGKNELCVQIHSLPGEIFFFCLEHSVTYTWPKMTTIDILGQQAPRWITAAEPGTKRQAFFSLARVIWLFLSRYLLCIKTHKWLLSCGLANACLKICFSRSLSTDFISFKNKQTNKRV